MINFLFKVFVGGAPLCAHKHFKQEISNRSKGCVEAACRRPASTQPLLLLRLHVNGGRQPTACCRPPFTCRRRSSCWWTAGLRHAAVHQQLLLLLLHVYVGRGPKACSPNINIEVVVFEKVVVGEQRAELCSPTTTFSNNTLVGVGTAACRRPAVPTPTKVFIG